MLQYKKKKQKRKLKMKCLIKTPDEHFVEFSSIDPLVIQLFDIAIPVRLMTTPEYHKAKEYDLHHALDIIKEAGGKVVSAFDPSFVVCEINKGNKQAI